MFRKTIQRCVASLLIAVTLGGAIAPLTANAKPSSVEADNLEAIEDDMTKAATDNKVQTAFADYYKSTTEWKPRRDELFKILQDASVIGLFYNVNAETMTGVTSDNVVALVTNADEDALWTTFSESNSSFIYKLKSFYSDIEKNKSDEDKAQSGNRDENTIYAELLDAYLEHTDFQLSSTTGSEELVPEKVGKKDIDSKSPMKIFDDAGDFLEEPKIENYFNTTEVNLAIVGDHNDPIPIDKPSDYANPNHGLAINWWVNGSEDDLNAFQAMADFINNDVSFPSMSSGGNADANPWTLIDTYLTADASGPVHNKLTQANIGYYTLMAYFALTNPDKVDEGTIMDVYTSLSMDYDYNYIDMMNHMGYSFYDSSFKDKDDLVHIDSFMYSEGVLGNALANLDGKDGSIYARGILFKCFEVLYSDVILMRKAEQNNDLTDPTFRNIIVAAKNYYNAFHEAFPIVELIYNYTPPNSTKSIATCAEDLNVSDDEQAALDDIQLSNFSSWNEKISDDNSTPIGNFYKIRGDVSITSVNKEMLWNDIQVSDTFDNEVIQFIEEEKRGSVHLDPNTGESRDLEYWYESIRSNAEAAWAKMFTGTSDSDTVDTSVEDGVASSYRDVTMGANIIDGMVYSSTYIPMRTQIDDPILLSTYDDDFYNNFYKKYGFMRKALLKDTSGTAAVDLYNNNGVFAGNLEICTLRDFIELEDNDLVLYVDPGFYNSEPAINAGNIYLGNHLAKYTKMADEMKLLIETYQTYPTVPNSSFFVTFLKALASMAVPVSVTENEDGEVEINMSRSEYFELMKETIYDKYKYNLPDSYFSMSDVSQEVRDIENANLASEAYQFTEEMLKDNGYTQYSPETAGALTELPNSAYVDLDVNDLTYDNFDSIVLPSSLIKGYLNASRTYISRVSDGDTIYTNSYDVETGYSPLMSLSYVSLLYRTARYYTLASAVLANNPVFIASDDLCGVQQSVTSDGVKQSNQWWRNSLLNYALVRNLKANVQVDYTYCVDLDNPVYMDIFGNILTENGMVVIPAAANATLHTAAYKEYDVVLALYSVYGKEYRIPTSLEGAYSVLHPWFEPDIEQGVYKVTGAEVTADSSRIRLDNLSESADEVKEAVQKMYRASVVRSGGSTRVNWYGMVNIINEVMRGAPIDNIDKTVEDLWGNQQTTSALVAAAKYESLLDSLNQSGLNTMLAIPDFSSMDNTEYYVALLIKIMMVVTAAVCIVFVYRDGVSGNLGGHTLFSVLGAVLLTFSCIVVVPAVFNLTYYGANKLLLEDEAMRILLVNEEKRQSGIEIGVTRVNTELPDDMFRIQLDWIQVPWYEQLNYVLYGSAIQTVDEVKDNAYAASPIIKNDDIIAQDNGVFITTSALFDSVGIDYTWKGTVSGKKGLYLWDTNTDQTASFYSPYYAFLTAITGSINEYNEDINTWSYTVKAQSGMRKKTVGLSYNYFMSEDFLYNQDDILHLRQIYMWADSDMSIINQDDNEQVQLAQRLDKRYIAATAQRYLNEVESASNRALLFSDDDREKFRSSRWYNIYALGDIDRRIEVMNEYARNFVADNHDLLTKVTDETFIKVMALNLAIKYNQLFGITTANSLEIDNLDSVDLLRLCTVDPNEAALSISMSFPRFVYNYGGEASVYAAAILSMILWVGSFIKPLCTIIVFISVFLSIWVFRVVLRKPSANLWGYLVTVVLLCVTNFMHSLLLKFSLYLPRMGLPMLGCMVFIIVGQVSYLLVLAYVTGVSLKDWSNLGYNAYQKEAQHIKAKFSHKDNGTYLSGGVQHYENNWDYYNELVGRHRKRNTELGAAPKRFERIEPRDHDWSSIDAQDVNELPRFETISRKLDSYNHRK